MAESHHSPHEANLKATAILDTGHQEIQKVGAMLLQQSPPGISFLQNAHLHLVRKLRPVYSVDERQPASRTLLRGRGSCSQRTAVLEAIARGAGVPTRVRAFAINRSFWYPRFRLTRLFIPTSVLLVWPQFYVGSKWIDFDELHAPVEQMASGAAGGFTNAGESLFEAVANTPVDFLGKTCGLACSKPEQDLSRFVIANHGFFNTRDEAFERLGWFQNTPRGYAFELVFGGRRSV